MNYKKIYDKLIDKRRKHPITSGYSEKHHIIPRCLGGSNAKDNIVRLTAREHYIAHLLLVHVYPGPKMLFAIRCMSISSKSHLGHREFIKNSRLFQIYREKAIEALKGFVTVRDKDGNTFHVSKDDPRFLSGELFHCTKGFVTVRDKNGNTFQVSVDDPRYISGELVGATKGKTAVRDKNGNTFQVSVDDPRYISGELLHSFKGFINVRDKDGKTFQVSKDDPRFLSGELVSVHKGFINVRDKDGKFFKVKLDDPRYLSGELVFSWLGKKHSKETIERLKLSHKGKHTGSKNSQFGTMWICNISTKENKKISKDTPIPEGWIKGRNKWVKKQPKDRSQFGKDAIWITDGKTPQRWPKGKPLPKGFYVGRFSKDKVHIIEQWKITNFTSKNQFAKWYSSNFNCSPRTVFNVLKGFS